MAVDYDINNLVQCQSFILGIQCFTHSSLVLSSCFCADERQQDGSERGYASMSGTQTLPARRAAGTMNNAAADYGTEPMSADAGAGGRTSQRQHQMLMQRQYQHQQEAMSGAATMGRRPQQQQQDPLNMRSHNNSALLWSRDGEYRLRNVLLEFFMNFT